MGAESMQKSYEQNRKMRNSQLAKRKSIFQIETLDSRKINLPKIPEEKSEKYLAKLTHERKKKFIREVIILLIVLTAIALVVLYSFDLIF